MAFSDLFERALTLQAELDAAKAEIARLREACERAEWWLSTVPEGRTMQAVLRAALNPDTGEGT
jgi:hypothetical protein